jgi:hypothetical protein
LEEWLYAEETPEQQVAFENVSNNKKYVVHRESWHREYNFGKEVGL